MWEIKNIYIFFFLFYYFSENSIPEAHIDMCGTKGY